MTTHDLGKLLLVSLLLVFITGCASTGRKLDVASIEQVKAGGNKEEVLRLIGSPDHKTISTNMLTAEPFEIWTYSFMNYQVDPVTFIPIVGMFAGASQVQMETLTVVFDGQGLVTNKTFTQSASEVRTGTMTADPAKLPDVEENKRPW